MIDIEDRARRCGLSTQVAAGCLVLAATVSGREQRVLYFYRSALQAGVPAQALAEVARMAHLIGGIPRAIEGLRCFGIALKEEGLQLPVAVTEPERQVHRERGLQLFRRIYAKQADPVLDRLEAILPGYSSWIIEHAYGRVLSRPELPAEERELLAVAALSAMRCPNQLKSHARGAMNLGATRAQVLSAITVLEGEQPEEVLAEARTVVGSLG